MNVNQVGEAVGAWLLADGEDIKAEFNIVNHDYPEGKTSYNVVGEIPGTDKPTKS